MRKFLLVIALFFLHTGYSYGQLVVVTGTVKDVNGTLYSGGTGRAVFIPNPANTQPVTLNGFPFTQTVVNVPSLGSFATFSIQVADTSILQPPNAGQWQFSFTSAGYTNPNISYSFTMTQMPIVGPGPLDITSTIVPQAAILPVSGGGGSCGNLLAGQVAFGVSFHNCGGNPNFIFSPGPGNLSVPQVNNYVYVDGIKYAQTDAGIRLAQAAAMAIPNSCVLFPPATYNLSTPLVITDNKTCWRGTPGAVLKYIGSSTAYALTFDGTGVTNGAQMWISDILVNGNEIATNGILFKEVERSVETNVQATNILGIGIQCSFCVLDTFINPTVSSNLNGGFPIGMKPSVGLQLDDVSGNESSTNTFINPMMEGITGTLGIGILDKSLNEQFKGGTSEGNKIGYEGTSSAQHGTVDGMFFEANSVQDVNFAGFDFNFRNLTATSANATNDIEFVSPANVTTLSQSYVTSVQIDTGSPAATNISVRDTQIATGNDITDNGTFTVVDNVFIGTGFSAEKHPYTFVANNFAPAIGGAYTGPATHDVVFQGQTGAPNGFQFYPRAGQVIQIGDGSSTWPDAQIVFQRNTNTANTYAIDFRTGTIQQWGFGNFAESNESLNLRDAASDLVASFKQGGGIQFGALAGSGNACLYADPSGNVFPVSPRVVCGTGGGGSGVTIATNGSNNAVQTTLNFIISTVNSCSLTNTPVNPAATGNEREEITGTLTSPCGGSGLSSPMAHGLLIGEGASPFTPLTMAVDTILQGQGTGVDPAALALTNCVGANAYNTSTHTFVCNALPGNTPAVTSQWINAYNSGTGAFTQTQPDLTDLTGTGNIVFNNQANTYSTGLQDFSAVTIKIPSAAAFVSTAASTFGIDTTTTKNPHVWLNSADAIIPVVSGTWVNGNCGSIVFTGGQYAISDNGSPCGSGTTTAYSTLTAGVTSHAGTFGGSGNTWDYTASTIFKLRTGAGLTTSASGDIGEDTTATMWHAYNGADSFIFEGLVSGTFTNNDCPKIAKSGSQVTLVDSGAGCGGVGTVTTFSAGNANPFFTTSVSNPTSTPALGFNVTTQLANCVFSGPTTGSAATPTCRALVATDIPTAINITGNATTATGPQNPPTNCSAGFAPTGLVASGSFNATGCNPLTILIVANAGSTGTTTSTLTKLTGAPSTAVKAATTDTGGIVGITISGAGTSSNATIQTAGQVNCVFDGATTAGDYVQISSGTAGDCTDAGATFPVSGQVIGRVLSTNGGAGTYQIDQFDEQQGRNTLVKFAGPTALRTYTLPDANATFLTTNALVTPTQGGTGQDTHSSTGIAQISSGTWSVSTALANGTTTTTQACSDNTTKVSTDAFVLGCALINPMTTLGDIINGGASGVPTRLAGSTGPDNVPKVYTSTSASGVATAVALKTQGVGCRSVSGTTDTIVATDRNGCVIYTSGSSVAVTVPQAGSTNIDNGFPFQAIVTGAGSVTFTPTTSTATVVTGTAPILSVQTSWVLTTGQFATAKPDAGGSNWFVTETVSGSSGNVNSCATQYSMAEYLNTGSVVSCNTHIVSDASNNLIVQGHVDAGNGTTAEFTTQGVNQNIEIGSGNGSGDDGGTGTVTVFNPILSGTIGTASDCSSAASPAVCGSATAGSILIPTGVSTSTLTVNTTAVTENSQIFFYPDDTLGTRLSVTCNSTLATLVGGSAITARTAGTSFQITFNGTIATNGVCGNFLIVN